MQWQQPTNGQQPWGGDQPGDPNAGWGAQPQQPSTNGHWGQPAPGAPQSGGYAQHAHGGQQAYGAADGWASHEGAQQQRGPYAQPHAPPPLQQNSSFGAPPSVSLDAATMQGVAAGLAMNYGNQSLNHLQSNVCAQARACARAACAFPTIP
jgi:hypothetical protein